MIVCASIRVMVGPMDVHIDTYKIINIPYMNGILQPHSCRSLSERESRMVALTKVPNKPPKLEDKKTKLP